MIKVFLCRKNSQHSTLANTDIKKFQLKITNKKYSQHLVSIAWICHNLIDSGISGSKLQHPMMNFHKDNTIFTKNIGQGIFSTNILAYLENYSIKVSAVHIEVIAEINFKLHILHLEKIYIKQRKFSDIYIIISGALLMFNYLHL